MPRNSHAAWGESYHSSIFRRQVKLPVASSEPIPGFFHTRAANSQPSLVSSPSPANVEFYEEEGTVFSTPALPQRHFSPLEDMSFPYENEGEAIAPSRYVVSMNQLNFLGVIGGISLIGVLFFAGGFLLALTVMSKALNPSAAEGTKQSLPIAQENVLSKSTNLYKEEPRVERPFALSSELALQAKSHLKPQSVLKKEEISQGREKRQVHSIPLPQASALSPTPMTWAEQGTVSEEIQKKQKAKLSDAKKTKPPFVDAEIVSRPYALQVGLFVTQDSAVKIATLLRKRGYNAYVVVGQNLSSSKTFAVRLGGFYTQEAALRAAEHLQKKEKFRVVAVARNNAERVIL